MDGIYGASPSGDLAVPKSMSPDKSPDSAAPSPKLMYLPDVVLTTDITHKMQSTLSKLPLELWVP